MLKPQTAFAQRIGVTLFWFLLLALLVSPGLAAERLDLNKATISELRKLPFIGNARAQAIIEQRHQLGGKFTSLDQLLQSPAIGPSTVAAIQPHITLAGSSPALPEKQRSVEYNFLPRIITQPGELMLLQDKAYYHTLLNFIQYAEQQIDIAMFLFKATKSPKNRPALLTKALIAARQRGVLINVVLENSGYDEQVNEENQRTAAFLRKNDIKVRFDSTKTTTHAKLIVIDQRFCFLGSHNFTQSALAYNHELSLLADSPAMAKELREYILGIQ